MKDTEKISRDLEKLTGDLKIAIGDAEELLKTAGKSMGGVYREASTGFGASLKKAVTGARELQHGAVGKIRETARTTDKYVRNHAWNVVGAGVFAGLLVGWLISRGNRGVGNSTH